MTGASVRMNFDSDGENMNGSPTFERLSRETLEEHRQIHFFLDQLNSALAALDTASTEVEPLRRLAAQIESLRERLDEHFESEEHGGLFQAILDALPDAVSEVHQLGAQHDRMVEVLEMARIHAQRGEPCEAGPLRTDLQNFLQMMRNHEQAEEDLVERALEEEMRSIS